MKSILIFSAIAASTTAVMVCRPSLLAVEPDSASIAADGNWTPGPVSSAGCVQCPPLWSFTGGALVLDRSRPDSIVLMADTTDPTRNLNANAFDFDWRAGWEVGVARQLGAGRLAARYFQVDSWNAATTAVTNSTLMNPLRINTAPPTFAPQVQSVDSTYGGDLHSLELNYELDSQDWWNLLAGFRWIELDEHLHANMNGMGQLFQYDTFTSNRLYGFQLGAQGLFWDRGGWQLEGSVKAGVYHNSQGHQSTFNTGVAAVSARENADRASFAGEFNFTASYSFSDQLTGRVGYNLLWLETMALASDQIPSTNLFTGRGITDDGGVFYHGATASLELRW